MQSGQSSVCPESVESLSELDTTTLIAPVPVQTRCIDFGFTSGDAIATPIVNAIQTSTKRAVNLALRNRSIR